MVFTRYKHLLLSLWLLAAPLLSAAQAAGSPARLSTISKKEAVGTAKLPGTIAPISAPFPMAQLAQPSFSNFSVSIMANGAKEGQKATHAIQQTIDNVSQRSGGKVVISPGSWCTGRIELKSNVNLHRAQGAALCFSGEVQDNQPAVFTRSEGVAMMSLGACPYANGGGTSTSCYCCYY